MIKFIIGFLLGAFCSYKYDLSELNDIFRMIEQMNVN